MISCISISLKLAINIQYKFLNCLLTSELAPVVQKVDNAIHWINHYSLDRAIMISLTLIPWIVIYPVDTAIQLLNNWGPDQQI